MPVPFVISAKGTNVRRPVENYDMLRMFREFLTWREGDAIILIRSECNSARGHELLRHFRPALANDV
jgi:hypothetical protein